MARSRYGRRSNTSRDMYGRKKVFASENDQEGAETVHHGTWMRQHGIIVNQVHIAVKESDHRRLQSICEAFGKNIDIKSTIKEKRALAWECLDNASKKDVVKASDIISSNEIFNKK